MNPARHVGRIHYEAPGPVREAIGLVAWRSDEDGWDDLADRLLEALE